MVKKLINTEKKLGKHGGRLVIHNLPFSMKEKSFLKLVKKIGEIKEHQLPWNQEENRNKGFGFVEYTKKNLGAKLIKNLNGKKISGRVLAVDWAVSKDVHQKL